MTRVWCMTCFHLIFDGDKIRTSLIGLVERGEYIEESERPSNCCPVRSPVDDYDSYLHHLLTLSYHGFSQGERTYLTSRSLVRFRSFLAQHFIQRPAPPQSNSTLLYTSIYLTSTSDRHYTTNNASHQPLRRLYHRRQQRSTRRYDVHQQHLSQLKLDLKKLVRDLHPLEYDSCGLFNYDLEAFSAYNDEAITYYYDVLRIEVRCIRRTRHLRNED